MTYPDFSTVSPSVRSGLRNGCPVAGTGCPRAGNVAAYFILPQVIANCHCAAAIDRTDDSAEASFPRACMLRYSANAIARTMAMMARTIINSIRVKPRSRSLGSDGFSGFYCFFGFTVLEVLRVRTRNRNNPRPGRPPNLENPENLE